MDAACCLVVVTVELGTFLLVHILPRSPRRGLSLVGLRPARGTCNAIAGSKMRDGTYPNISEEIKLELYTAMETRGSSSELP